MTADDQALVNLLAETLHANDWRGVYTAEEIARRWQHIDPLEARRYIDQARAVLPVVKTAQRDAARGALDGFSKWLGELAEKHPTRTAYVPLAQGNVTRYTNDHYPEES